MHKEFKEFFEKLDLSDVRLLIVGILVFMMPVFYFFFFSGARETTVRGTRLTHNRPGQQSAFNLTTTTPKARVATPRSVLAQIDPPAQKIERELEDSWNRIQAIPRIVSLPPDTPPDVRSMIEAEEDERLWEANSLLDQSNFDAAERAYKDVIENSGQNQFKELYAIGGLMEIYQLKGDMKSFRDAFSRYAKVAQQLQHVYGPLADNVARAYEMFEQITRIDSGKLREYLTRANLGNSSPVSYEDFIKSINQTRQWFPDDLGSPEPKMPDLPQPNLDG